MKQVPIHQHNLAVCKNIPYHSQHVGGRWADSTATEVVSIQNRILLLMGQGNITGVNNRWREPAQTEYNAYHQLVEMHCTESVSSCCHSC